MKRHATAPTKTNSPAITASVYRSPGDAMDLTTAKIIPMSVTALALRDSNALKATYVSIQTCGAITMNNARMGVMN